MCPLAQLVRACDCYLYKQSQGPEFEPQRGRSSFTSPAYPLLPFLPPFFFYLPFLSTFFFPFPYFTFLSSLFSLNYCGFLGIFSPIFFCVYPYLHYSFFFFSRHIRTLPTIHSLSPFRKQKAKKRKGKKKTKLIQKHTHTFTK